MKIIPLYRKKEKKVIKKAMQNDGAAQKEIYESYAPKMLGVCRMYIKDLQYAEDVLIKGFYKVFKNLKNFKNEGSFEGWIRKIMIRESIDFLRIKNKLNFSSNLEEDFSSQFSSNFVPFATDYIQELIDHLPQGYKIVFMMNVVEGYNHREIAEELGIRESTSRSQLAKARKMLQQQLHKKDELQWN